MLSRLFGQLSLIVTLAAAGATCKSDPTAAGTGTPVAVQAALASINVPIGGTGTVTATVVDVRQTPLEASITFTSCNASIATVAVDTSYHAVPPTSARAVVTSVLSGTTCIVLSSPGAAPDTVVVNVAKGAPTISTSRTATGTLGAILNDTATLAGGFALTGTITFQLYDSTKATCASGPLYTQVVTVNGAGSYRTSPGFTSNKVGTWRWTAAYSGDVNNVAVASACAAEPVAILAPTTLTTVPTPATAVNGDSLRDAATLGGGIGTPTGKIVFRLYDPTKPTCIGTPRLTDSVTVAGTGTYNSKKFKSDAVGTWRWTAEYTGDGLNETKKTACNDEQVPVS